MMTSLLSTISGQFSKSLILGTLLPVMVFVLLFHLLITPLLPPDWPIWRSLSLAGTEGDLVPLSLAALVLTGILFNLNNQIISFYEGYPWKDTALGKRCTQYHQARQKRMEARSRGWRTLLRRLPPTDPRFLTIYTEMDALSKRLPAEYPRHDLVLPTRLGNVLRSFEDYSYRQYCIEAITLWPRLTACLPPEFASLIGNSRMAFDFAVNCSLLSALLAVFIAILGSVSPLLLFPAERWYVPWLAQIFLFSWLSFAMYLLAVRSAGSWGEQVKSAFDLYRGDLLKRLGYARIPGTLAEERRLWNDISQQFLYEDNPSVPLPVYRAQPVSAFPDLAPGANANVTSYLTVVRGVSGAGRHRRVMVTLQIRNEDVRQRPAVAVVVTDTMPGGFDYEWDSAHCSVRNAAGAETEQAVAVSGANPLVFRIAALDFGEQATITYQILPQNAG